MARGARLVSSRSVARLSGSARLCFLRSLFFSELWRMEMRRRSIAGAAADPSPEPPQFPSPEPPRPLLPAVPPLPRARAGSSPSPVTSASPSTTLTPPGGPAPRRPRLLPSATAAPPAAGRGRCCLPVQLPSLSAICLLPLFAELAPSIDVVPSSVTSSWEAGGMRHPTHWPRWW
ncbi:hypothetical protein PVAP13_8NG121302 [Panicum virgatum]|uniref:Uncharacterized protein n=1 Tax=Panicum virgatum TaxID=38727 RepID=A0A8T0PB97_PANVG|nr:hypothetical protein PVAP13_8NG121302 [Panicum virgatum]